jgi:steroid delta-isomerase-like uncharacterized protein
MTAGNGPAAVAERHIDAINQHDSQAVTSLYQPDATWVGPMGRNELRGHRAMRLYLDLLLDAFPDLTLSQVRSLGGQDSIAVEWRARATHAGPFLGLAATRKRVDVSGLSILDLRHGMIALSSHYCDGTTLLRQIGGLPEGIPL